MKYGNYHLPSGVDLSSITYEDIRWQYGVFRCNSTGSGRYKKRFPWDGVKTNLGEIEEKDWCRLAEAVIERDGEAHLLKHLVQWCTEHNYIGASAAELRKEALQLHIDRVLTIRNGAATFLSIRDTAQKSGEPPISYMCGTNAAVRFPPSHKSRSTMHTTGQSHAHTAEDGVILSFWEAGFSRSHWFPA